MAHPRAHVDLGLLVLRIGIGVMFGFHGLTKLVAGPVVWERVGSAMGNFGISFFHSGFGFAAGLVELAGGILIAVGLLFRTTCAILAGIMVVAVTTKFGNPELGFWSELKAASHPIELLIVFVSLIGLGAGRYALDQRYRMRLTNRYLRSDSAAGATAKPGAQRSTVATEVDVDRQ